MNAGARAPAVIFFFFFFSSCGVCCRALLQPSGTSNCKSKILHSLKAGSKASVLCRARYCQVLLRAAPGFQCHLPVSAVLHSLQIFVQG